MYSGACVATIGAQQRGVATVTSPAPDLQRALRREHGRAGLAARSRDDQHAAEIAFVRIGCARRDQRCASDRASSARRAARRATRRPTAGMPMSAMTTSPDFCSAGGRISGSLGAPSVTVTVASMQSPMRSAYQPTCPDGRSIDTTGIADALMSAMTVS